MLLLAVSSASARMLAEVVCCWLGWKGRSTFFMFSARRSYSSNTSCWRGVSSGCERGLFDWSILGIGDGRVVVEDGGCEVYRDAFLVGGVGFCSGLTAPHLRAQLMFTWGI